MDKTARNGNVNGKIIAPSSKSYAQRAIAAALLAEGESRLTNMVLCNDTRAALQVARDLGAEITNNETTYTIKGGLNPRSTKINIGESGLAARLFTPVASLCDYNITITGEGSILRRPLDMVEAPLMELGVEVTTNGGYLPITVQGPVQGGNIEVDGSQSSQFITGLLVALPLANKDTTLTVTNLKSRPYVDMTIELLDKFGIEVKHNDYTQFYVPGTQKYTPTEYNIEGDWSGASCLLVAGATTGQITIGNLNPLSLQADTAIIEALTKAGAEIISTPDSVTVKKLALKAFEFDATDSPDLFPALAALAAACEGTSTIVGTKRLAYKESNRAKTIAETFSQMGIRVDIETENVMKITGGPVSASIVSSHNDHRIAMAAAVTALRSEDGVVTIREAEAVEKSYPEFWSDLESVL